MPQCRNRPACESRSHCWDGFCRSAEAGAATSPSAASAAVRAMAALRSNERLPDMSDLHWSGPHVGVLQPSPQVKTQVRCLPGVCAANTLKLRAIRVKYLIYDTRDPISS